MCSFISCFWTFTIEKNWRSQNLSERKICRKENLKKCTSFENQKGTRYIRENIYFGITIFSCLSSTKACLRFLLNCSVREIKVFYQSSLGNQVDFRDIMNVSPNILAKNQNFRKVRHGFVDERALIATKLTSSCHWKPLHLFVCERKDLKTHFQH